VHVFRLACLCACICLQTCAYNSASIIRAQERKARCVCVCVYARILCTYVLCQSVDVRVFCCKYSRSEKQVMCVCACACVPVCVGKSVYTCEFLLQRTARLVCVCVCVCVFCVCVCELCVFSCVFLNRITTLLMVIKLDFVLRLI
jgi:hypothetical protein